MKSIGNIDLSKNLLVRGSKGPGAKVDAAAIKTSLAKQKADALAVQDNRAGKSQGGGK